MAIMQTLLPRICRASFQQILKPQYSTNRNESKFSKLELVTPTKSEALARLFSLDKNVTKVNLAGDVFRTAEDRPCVLSAVRKAELSIAKDEKLHHDYLPALGNVEFTNAATALLLGQSSSAILQNRAFGIQTLSGTGALRLAVDFLHKDLNYNVCLLSEPTSDAHESIFRAAGFTRCHKYKYQHIRKSGELALQVLLSDIMSAPDGAVVLLQPCAHDPTGVDPSDGAWRLIAHVLKCKKMLPLFDMRYQGLASGNPDTDAWPVPFFVESGLDVMCAQSFSNNFCLYNERLGNLTVVLNEAAAVEAVKARFEALIRNSYKSPPAHGSRVVAKILRDPSLRNEWFGTLKEMTSHIRTARLCLAAWLKALHVPGDWDALSEQQGMFSRLDLAEYQIEKLMRLKHIYLPKSGRVNVCALNEQNVKQVANGIKDVLETNRQGDAFISQHCA